MLNHRLLTEAEYQSCMAVPMQNVTEIAEAVVNIWPYVDSLDLDQIGIEKVNDVHYIYRSPTGQFDHVNIGTSRFNSILVIVVDRYLKQIFGHWVLDLNEKYDVSGQHLRSVQ